MCVYMYVCVCVCEVFTQTIIILSTCSTDKLKGTIQLLQQNTDTWHVGEQTIDLRMTRRSFAAVQKYVPECHILINDVESHMRMAEEQMFPARLQKEESWAHAVLQDVLKTKVEFIILLLVLVL